jgi:hypothetical protein
VPSTVNADLQSAPAYTLLSPSSIKLVAAGADL